MVSVTWQVIFYALTQLLISTEGQFIWDSSAAVNVLGDTISSGLSIESTSTKYRHLSPFQEKIFSDLTKTKFVDFPPLNKGANTIITTGRKKSYRTEPRVLRTKGPGITPASSLYKSVNQQIFSPATDSVSCGFTSKPKGSLSSSASFRVVGGEKAQPHAWPWMAAVGHFRKATQKVDFHCGGTLISDIHVLTAAHCILFPRIKVQLVRLGVVNLHDTHSAVDVRVKRTVAHHGFDWISGANDIGVIVLDRKLHFTDSIRPICLPNGRLTPQEFKEDLPFVAGWGLTKDMKLSSWLQEASLPLVSFEKCRKIYAELPPDRMLYIRKGQICGGYDAGGRDACQGDSGGPLMISSQHSEGPFYLIGIISLGDGCGQPGIPGIFSDVVHYQPWLQRVLNTTYGH